LEERFVLTVTCLGSGSSGNALLVEERGTILLVDCGVSPRLLESGLRQAGHAVADLAAVLLTHEHIDHVRSCPRLQRGSMPFVATGGTAAAISLAASRLHQISIGDTVRIGGLTVTSLPVSHDAAEPCAFRIAGVTGCIVVATDLGRPGEEWRDLLPSCDLIVIEANHDIPTLEAGPYPARLKRRILSSRGHLSNTDCGRFLASALGDQLTLDRGPTIWLAHLSETNNRAAIAQAAVRDALASRGLQPPVITLPRHGAGTTWREGEQERLAPHQLSFFH